MKTALTTSIALLLLAGTAQAGKYQLLTYSSSKGEPRVCKGDTSSGTVTCADGTPSSARVTGASMPSSWAVKEKAITTHLRYRLGAEQAAAGRYQFFRYYSNKSEVRICAGDTASGVAVCADGTAESARVTGAALPSNWKVKPKAQTFLLKYFQPTPAKPGRFGFAAYRNSRHLARICRIDTATGDTFCADGTAVSAAVVGLGKPEWRTKEKAETVYLRY